MLIERIAALGDKAALSELDRRHGMTLYAIAYTLLLESETSDVAVAAALRALWRQAASFDPRLGNARAWLGELTRRAACERLRALRRAQWIAPVGRSTQRGSPAPRTRRRRAWDLARRGVARVAQFATVLALPTLLARWLRA
jgi:DNA-directed RNA polymerase specialized sigma24 family protein